MTLRTLILRSLRFHWRAHLGVVLGAAVGSAALIGALVVGDSVRESLRERAERRLPNMWAAMTAGDRFLSNSIIERIHDYGSNQFRPSPDTLSWGDSAASDSVGFAVIQLAATVSRSDESHRVNHITLFGVDGEFARQMLGPQSPLLLTNG